jgi:lipopolysaccharide/colanic/teichoic acid biosynthesis glycosyltransferase/ADP-glucose pyrophosphorylase
VSVVDVLAVLEIERSEMDRRVHTAVLLANGPAVLDGSQIASFPKCFLPIANRPLLFYQAATLMSAGVTQLILVVGAEQGQITQRIVELIQDLPIETRCYVQEHIRGTAGSLKEIEHLLQADRFLVMSSDLFLDADLEGLVDYHLGSEAIATVAAAGMELPAWQMERIETDTQELAKTIHRIHPAYSRRSKLRPIGLYLFEHAVLQFVPEEGVFDIKEQLVTRLYSHLHRTRVWTVDSYYQNILSGTRYLAANADVLQNQAVFSQLKRYLPRVDTAVAALGGYPARVTVSPVIQAPSSTIHDGAMVIGPTAIGAGCSIGRNAIVNASVLLDGCKVGAGAHLTGCVLGEGAVVPDGAAFHNVIVRSKTQKAEAEPLVVDSTDIGASCLCSSRETVTSRMTKNSRFIKRVFDMVFSASSLLVLAPLMAAIAIWIKLDSPGEVIFRQRRCAENGKEFTMYKFRSMVDNAEEVKREIQVLNEVDGPMFKLSKDPRATRAGWILRATNLDELPQLWNIFLGDMSLIGPRPLSWDEMRFNPRWRDVRLSVPQGLIGLWQVKSHSKASFADWIRYDMEYVSNWSAWLDLKIFAKAFFNMTVGHFRSLENA